LTDLIGSFGPVFVVSAAVFGPLSGWLAGRRDRHPVVWLLLGALLGPIAILLLSASPPGRCPMCDTPVRGWASICAVCGAPLSITAGAGRYPDERRRSIASVAPVAGPESRPYTSPVASPRTTPLLTILAPGGVEGGPVLSTAPEPIRLPVERSATARIRRPGFASATKGDGPDQSAVAEVLATGVYFGGTAGLAVGGRYVIVRQGPQFRLLGPVDLDPTRVALERPLARLVAVAVGERLVITEGDSSRVSLAIGMGALAGMSGPELELALARPEGSTMDRQPASG
jgi:hypothetical protein